MEKCHWCGGRCRVTCDCTGGVGREAAADDCPACGGSGYHTCPACGGTGRENSTRYGVGFRRHRIRKEGIPNG